MLSPLLLLFFLTGFYFPIFLLGIQTGLLKFFLPYSAFYSFLVFYIFVLLFLKIFCSCYIFRDVIVHILIVLCIGIVISVNFSLLIGLLFILPEQVSIHRRKFAILNVKID